MWENAYEKMWGKNPENSRVSVWEDEKVLQTHGSDGCTTMRVYSMPLNCARRVGKTVIWSSDQVAQLVEVSSVHQKVAGSTPRRQLIGVSLSHQCFSVCLAVCLSICHHHHLSLPPFSSKSSEKMCWVRTF